MVVLPGRQGAAAVGEAADGRGQAGRQGFAPRRRAVVHFGRAAPDLQHERPQGQQLPVREDRAPAVEAVARQAGRAARVGRRPVRADRFVGRAERDFSVHGVELAAPDPGRFDLLRGGPAVLLAPLPVDDDGSHADAQPARAARGADVFGRGDRAAAGARGAAAAHGAAAEPPVVLAPAGRGARPLGHVRFDVELDARPVRARRHRQPDALRPLLAEPARLQQRDLRAAGGVADGPRPQVRHHRLGDPARVRVLLQIERVELRVQPGRRHPSFRIRLEPPRRPPGPAPRRRAPGPPPPLPNRRLELGVRRVARRQCPPRAVEHAPPPRPQMPREVRRLGRRGRLRQAVEAVGRRLVVQVAQLRQLALQVPRLRGAARLQEGRDEDAVAHGERRQRPRLSGQQPRVVQRAAQDEPRHRVQVRRGHLAAEAHRLQRDGPAAGERVEHPRRPPAEGVPDLAPERLDGGGVVLAPPVQDPAARLLLHPPAARVRYVDQTPRHPLQQGPSRPPVVRVAQQRRQQHGPARRQRPARRPDVQRRNVPVADVLLVDGVDGRLPQREDGLDEPGVGHRRRRRSANSRSVVRRLSVHFSASGDFDVGKPAIRLVMRVHAATGRRCICM